MDGTKIDRKLMETRKTIAAALALLLSAAPSVASVKVSSIDFKAQPTGSLVEITSDKPLAYEKTDNAQDRQIVLELKDAKLAKSARRKLDTSSFQGKISLVSPYQVDGQGDTSRVVIQLREPASGEVSQDGNVLKIFVPGGAAPTRPIDPIPVAQNDAAPADPAQALAPAASGLDAPSPESANANATEAQAPTPADQPQGSSNTEVTKASAVEKALDGFLEAHKDKRYVGKPITLQIREMDILDVFQLIGEASGFNVIVGEEVKGKVTLSLTDTPWDQALDLILNTRQLGAERHNNVLRITTLSNLTSEKQAELAAKKATEATAPRITRIFPISYARLGDLVTMFQKLTTQGSDTVVQSDDRTNSILVRDTTENIERLRKIIELLDTQTPQVLIEAKVIEATETAANGISGQIGLGGTGREGDGGVSFNGAGLDALGLSNVSTNAKGGGAIGLSPLLAFIPGTVRLNAMLSISEKQTSVKVIASPRTVVLNKESASIVAGQPVLIPQITTTTTGPITNYTAQQANLSLNVKPTVTNDFGVLLDVQVTRDVPQSFGDTTLIANRNMTTKVLVDSGSTLVIGGIYSSQASHSESGFPFLRKIPILGALFGSESDDNARSELFIFLTPRILNEKEAGLST